MSDNSSSPLIEENIKSDFRAMQCWKTGGWESLEPSKKYPATINKFIFDALFDGVQHFGDEKATIGRWDRVHIHVWVKISGGS